jgi:hypothetical protein
MQLFGQRKRLRRLAGRTLLLWLFALTSGLVNACVVEPGLRGAELSLAQGQVDSSATHPHQYAVGATGHVQPSLHADKVACMKHCDEKPARGPTVKQTADPPTIWIALPLSPSLTIQSARSLAGVFGAEQGPVLTRVPILIAFPRLRL